MLAAASLVFDASRAMDVGNHYILDNAVLLNKVSDCLKGVDVSLDINTSVHERVHQMRDQLRHCLEQWLLCMSKHVRHNSVWSVCQDNLHSFSQLLALTGQLPKQVIACSAADFITKPHQQMAIQTMESFMASAFTWTV